MHEKLSYSIKHINEIIQGGFARFHSDDGIEHLLLDSRKLIFPATTLFFALQGPRRDGLLFTDELYERGVRNFVLQGGMPDPSRYPEANCILVKDTLKALQQLAAFHRNQFNIPVLGITGSNGKTIVKEWLNQLLEDHYHIVRSPRSYNSQTGVPLSVWQMNASHELAIFEAGISQPGEMQQLEKIIRPTIGIFTNIGEAHSEHFKNEENKAQEKLILFNEAEVLIYPADDNPVARAIRSAISASPDRPSFPPILFSWGADRSCTVLVKDIVKKDDSTSITFIYRETASSVIIPFTDDASVENAMTCVCVLLYLDIRPEDIAAKLLQLSPIAMRLELKRGINHCTVINDSYNADLSSLKIALDFLGQQHQHNKRTVILSDILQSGKEQQVLYQEIAHSLQQKKINRLIGIGAEISAYGGMFGNFGITESNFYVNVDAFKKDLSKLVFREETILLKGARIFEFEKIDQLLAEQVHQTVMEINLNAMVHNLKQYQQLLQPSTKVMAMVKAFAYGSGSYEIASVLQFHKVDYLAVAYADEGMELRRAGITLPVMVMNTEDSSFELLVQYHLEPVLYSLHLFRVLDKFLRKEGLQQFPVHLELETGMNRLGFAPGEIDTLSGMVKNSSFRVQSVFSHLAASEEMQQDAFTERQAALFAAAINVLGPALGYPFLKHLANSAGIIRHPALQMDMVRLGIGLYGVDSAESGRLDLLEVSSLQSTIAQIKNINAGETVGYNRKGIAEEKRVIATVRIGYADGYPRSLGNGNGKMWVNGHLCPVTGSICMDMTMIDITGIAGVQEGDEVTVFGRELPVQQVAHWAGTIPYEILTGISQRVKRIYYDE